MKIFSIKRYLGTLAAALTLSAASLGAQAAAIEYSYTGTVGANPGSAFVSVDIGGSLGAFFTADAGGNGLIELGEFDETLGYNGFANRTATRYALRNSDNSPAFPALVDGSSTASSLTVDGTGSITGGSVTLNVAVPTGTYGELTIDVDAGTWAFYLGGGTLLTATGTGAFEPVAAVPVPAAAWLFGSALVGLVGVGRRRKLAA